ncbi:MAG: hypothetical protein M4579_004377 [Chaenotheca gracillima]|nr:MAG: hypothetical protein M4579_004377 [Chaenotheca gracillima]
MASETGAEKDRWSAQAYNAAAGFVPKLTMKVFSYLDPQSHERILDLGCGDGPLTAQIAERAQSVLGLDSSASLLGTARERYSHLTNCEFREQDCRYLDTAQTDSSTPEARASFDKVFSNAALHWILRDASTRASVFTAAHKLLKPGGRLVFEMGGHGNVGDVHAALRGALLHRGVSVDAIDKACPWFFPSEAWMSNALTAAGFTVEICELESRPTRLSGDGGGGGLEGWVRLMGAEFLETLSSDQERDDAVQEIQQVLKPILTREEDGSMWLGYVRLRAVARKA